MYESTRLTRLTYQHPKAICKTIYVGHLEYNCEGLARGDIKVYPLSGDMYKILEKRYITHITEVTK